jgi:thiol-disulfide isomerase/thioredoxin
MMSGLFLAIMVALAGPDTARAQGIKLGEKMPMIDVAVKLADGNSVVLSSLKGEQGTVVIFWSNQCPWVRRYESRVTELVDAFSEKGIGFVLINANDSVAFPRENTAESGRNAQRYQLPYLIDEGSRLARAFGATQTPHIFLFDPSDVLVYVGKLDDSPGDPGNVQNSYLKEALTLVLQGNPVVTAETPAFGCQIKFQD